MAKSHGVTNIFGRFNKLPLTLFRIQTTWQAKLRDYQQQLKIGQFSYDVKLHEDGLVHSIPVTETKFMGPNGMSLRPSGPNFFEILANFRGQCIFVLPKDTELPSQFTLLHEHTDHYSLQTTQPVSLKEFNQRLTAFLNSFEMIDKATYMVRYRKETGL